MKRFPDDFMFQLTDEEIDFTVSQNAIPSRKHLGGYNPYVVTEARGCNAGQLWGCESGMIAFIAVNMISFNESQKAEP